MSLLPLFPLPNVVLFPDVLLPLHIFEPRYRAMVGDALAGDRRIGMVLLRAGYEAHYEGRPPIYAVGCSGVIVHSIKLDDGRYNIILHGLERFRVVSEDHARAYRRATIDTPFESPLDAAARTALNGLRSTLESQLNLAHRDATEAPSKYVAQLATMPDANFVHMLAHYLDLEPVEKQALLERDSIRERAEALIDLLDMKRAHTSRAKFSDVRH